MINDGANLCINEAELLMRIKKLAVKGQNIMVNRSTFLQMGQDVNEPVTAFIARLLKQANLCNFNVTSTCSGCALVNTFSYQDNIIAHQLGRALVDPDIQERMMSSHGDKSETLLRI